MSATENRAGFLVAVFTARTTNAQESNPETAKLPGLWQKFQQTFPDHQGEVYSIYTNYQADQNGEYTCGVGIRLESKEDCPQDMEGLAIPAADYLAYPASGPQPRAVLAAWQKIWGDFNPDYAGLRRTFGTDYEVHSGPHSADVYVSVRKLV